MRLFVSVDLPDDLAEAVAGVQERFGEAVGLRFTDPAQAHITLKFLGEVPRPRRRRVESAIEEAVASVDLAPFEATVAGLGAFPSEEYIRVIWLGVTDGAEGLTRLHEAVEDRLVRAGFDAEDHAFTPHVTIARMEHAESKALVQRELREAEPTVGSMPVSEVRLTESERGPDGPVYSTVARFPLEGTAASTD